MIIGITIILMLLALLAIPVKVTFEVPSDQREFTWSWAFGLVRGGSGADRAHDPTTSNADDKPKDIKFWQGQSKHASKLFKHFLNRGMWKRITKYVGKMFRSVKKKDLSARIRVGLGDPADTGQLWAVFGPVAELLSNVDDASIQLEPEFFDHTLDLSCSGTIRFTPLILLFLSIQLIFSLLIFQGASKPRAASV